MYLSTPTASVPLQKPVKIFRSESVLRGERIFTACRAGASRGSMTIITTVLPRSHGGTFTPTEEKAEVIMRFLKATGLLVIFAQTRKNTMAGGSTHAAWEKCSQAGSQFSARKRLYPQPGNCRWSSWLLWMGDSCATSGSDLCST